MPSSAHCRLMLNAPSRSTRFRHAGRLSAATPAEKIPFHRQLADLRVQVADRRLVLRRAGRSAAGEHLVQPLDRLPLPGAHLVRMDLVLGRDSLHRSVPPQRLERHPFLEVRREPAAPFRRHPSASPRPWNTPWPVVRKTETTSGNPCPAPRCTASWAWSTLLV